jgi:hypothetical protein
MGRERFVPGKGFVAVEDLAPEADPLTEREALLGPPEKLSYRGELRDFYKIGALARALNRAVGTIRKWETRGYIPKPSFGLPTDALGGKIRLYSLPQIMGLREIAEAEGLLIDTSRSVKGTEFTAKARALFERLQDDA